MTTQRKYTEEEASRLADALYEREILPKVLNEHFDKYLVLNFETGQYEMDEDDMTAINRALLYSSPDVLVTYRFVDVIDGGRVQITPRIPG